jgi:hypothetical protein
MSKKQSFLKFILSISISILILGIIALIGVDRNTAQFFVLVFTMLMNIVLSLVVSIMIYIEGLKARKKK